MKGLFDRTDKMSPNLAKSQNLPHLGHNSAQYVPNIRRLFITGGAAREGKNVSPPSLPLFEGVKYMEHVYGDGGINLIIYWV